MRLVVFHMIGCPHCKAVSGPNSILRGIEDLVPVYEIESSDPATKQAGISSFPTIRLVTPLVTFGYEGPRTLEDLRRFVIEKMGQCLTLATLLKRSRKKPRDIPS